MMSKTRGIWSYLIGSSKNLNVHSDWILRRDYASPPRGPKDCKRALVDIPREPICDKDCERRKKKKGGILHKIKLKVLEGGSNFGCKLSVFVALRSTGEIFLSSLLQRIVSRNMVERSGMTTFEQGRIFFVINFFRLKLRKNCRAVKLATKKKTVPSCSFGSPSPLINDHLT